MNKTQFFLHLISKVGNFAVSFRYLHYFDIHTYLFDPNLVINVFVLHSQRC